MINSAGAPAHSSKSGQKVDVRHGNVEDHAHYNPLRQKRK